LGRKGGLRRVFRSRSDGDKGVDDHRGNFVSFEWDAPPVILWPVPPVIGGKHFAETSSLRYDSVLPDPIGTPELPHFVTPVVDD
jgi:hypothetical protein